MITILFLNFLVVILGAIFSLFPVIDKLPVLFGFDIDTAIVNGMGSLQALFSTFWILQDIFYGFLALMTYYTIKVVIKFFLGSRTPTND